jgi:hypothetical protein
VLFARVKNKRKACNGDGESRRNERKLSAVMSVNCLLDVTFQALLDQNGAQEGVGK